MATGLMHALDPRRFAWGNHPSAGVSAIIALRAFAGVLWLAIRRLRRMDIP